MSRLPSIDQPLTERGNELCRDRFHRDGHEGDEDDGDRRRRSYRRRGQTAEMLAHRHRLDRAEGRAEEGRWQEGGAEEGRRGEEEGGGEDDQGAGRCLQGIQSLHDHALLRPQRRGESQCLCDPLSHVHIGSNSWVPYTYVPVK